MKGAMNDIMTNTSSIWGVESPNDQLVSVDRAAADLRRGLGVVVGDDAGTRLLVAAAEGLTDALLAHVRSLGPQATLLLTPERAQTLAMRLYTGAVAMLDLPEEGSDANLAADRWTASRIAALADPTADLDNPWRGPFLARREPVSGPTDAALKLAKLAKLLPAVIVVPVDDVPPGLALVSASEILTYDEDDATAMKMVAHAPVPLAGAEETRIFAFRPDNGGTEHLAIMVGNPTSPGPVLVRLHSECFTGDLLGSLKCDCGDQLRGAIQLMGDKGEGIVLYLAQEGRGIGLINKLRAYDLQAQGFDTMEANGRLGFEDDERLFAPAAEMLKRMGFSKIKLMTNNPDKVAGLEAHGIEVTERVSHKFPPNPHNLAYLMVKKEKGGHDL